MPHDPKWSAHLDTALNCHDTEKVIKLCESHQPPLKKGEIGKISERICTTWGHDSSQTSKLLSALLERGTEIALKLYCELVWRSTTTSPPQALFSLMNLAEHDDWQVREYVASSAGELFDRHFEELSDYISHFAEAGTPRIKRAVALAVKKAGKSRDSTRVDFLLNVVSKLLDEDDPYVMENLGPFAIGDGLLRYYTDETIEALNRWSKSKNPIVRWNVAMALTTASARWRAALVKPILERLASDPDERVRKAVAKAKRNLMHQEKTA